METINGLGMIFAGLAVCVFLLTGRRLKYNRRHSVPIAIVAAGVLMHGTHHLLEMDSKIGSLSDVFIWFGLIFWILTRALHDSKKASRFPKPTK